MTATEGAWRATRSIGDWRQSIVERTLLASVALLLVLALFVAIRRLGGALGSPLPTLPLLATAVGLLAWSICLRAVQRGLSGTKLLEWSSTVALLLFAFACSYPGGRLIDWLVWVPVLAVSWCWPRVAIRPARRSSPAIGIEPLSERVLQQLTRCRVANGQEIVRGTLTVELAPDERTTTLHVAFCPPFERLPHVEARVASDSHATVKTAQVLHNGARLEVRLAKPASVPTAVSVELLASEPAEN